MRALCLCNSGHVRSVCLARLLNKRGIEALAAGVDECSDDTLMMLFEWATVIYFQADALVKLQKRAAFKDAGRWTDKVHKGHWTQKFDSRFDVGPDDWKEPHHPDLLRRMRDLVEKNRLLGQEG